MLARPLRLKVIAVRVPVVLERLGGEEELGAYEASIVEAKDGILRIGHHESTGHAAARVYLHRKRDIGIDAGACTKKVADGSPNASFAVKVGFHHHLSQLIPDLSWVIKGWLLSDLGGNELHIEVGDGPRPGRKMCGCDRVRFDLEVGVVR